MNLNVDQHRAYVLDRQQRLRQESDARRLLRTSPLDSTTTPPLTTGKDRSIMLRLISTLRLGPAAALAAAIVALLATGTAAAADAESSYIPFVTDFPQAGPVTSDVPVAAPASSGGIEIGWLEVLAGGIAFAAIAALLLAPAVLFTRRTRLARG